MPLIAILTVAGLLILGYSLMFIAAVHGIDDINDLPASVPDIVRRQQSRRRSDSQESGCGRTCFCRDTRRVDWVDEFYRVHGGE